MVPTRRKARGSKELRQVFPLHDNDGYLQREVAIRKLRGFCEIGASHAQLKHDDRTDAIPRYQYLHSM